MKRIKEMVADELMFIDYCTGPYIASVLHMRLKIK